MENPVIQFFVLKDGIPTSLSIDEVKKLIGAIEQVPAKPPVIDPPATQSVYGSPRVLEGYNADKQAVYSSHLFHYLLLQVGDDPDAFVPKGTNYEYTPLPLSRKLTGADTDWSGNTPPADFVQPKGYRKCYFKDKNGKPQPDQAYYEQSDEPDEVLDTVVVDEPIVVVPPVTQGKPTTPTQNIGDDQIVAGNPDVLNPVVVWKNGMAGIVNDANPTVGADETTYYWMGGGSARIALPTGYPYEPGQSVGLMMAIVKKGANPNYGGSAWSRKGWANVLIGAAPKNQ